MHIPADYTTAKDVVDFDRKHPVLSALTPIVIIVLAGAGLAKLILLAVERLI